MKLSLVAAVLILAAGGIWFFRTQQQVQRQAIGANLLSVTSLKAKQISEWRSERLGNAFVLTSRKVLINSVQRYLSDPTELERSELVRRLNPVLQQYHLADIFVVNTQKELKFRLVSQNSSEKGCSLDHMSAIDTAFAERRPVLTPLNYSAKVKYPHISIIAPLFSEKKEPVGAVVLVADASRFLYPLVQSWQGFTQTAETLLVRKEGDHVLFLSQSRHMKDTALKLRIPLNREDVPAVMAVKGITGIVEGKDYRGVRVIAAMLPVPDSPWFMISKIDTKEAFAELRFRSVMTALVILGGMILIAVIAFVIYPRRLEAHYLSIYKSILETAIDGFWITDLSGAILEVNEAYCTIMGFSNDELCAMNVTELDVVKSSEEISAHIAEIIERGSGYDRFETRHRRKDGSVCDIEMSVRYLPFGNGKLVGFLRDITEKKLTEQSLRERESSLRALLKAIPDLVWLKDMSGVYLACNPMFERFFGEKEEGIIGRTDYDFVEEELADFFRENDLKAIAADKPRANEEWITFADDGHRALLETIKTPMFDERGEAIGVLGIGRDITGRKNAEQEKLKLEKQLNQAQKMESIGRLAGGVAHDFNNMLGVILGYGEMALAQTEPSHPLHAKLQEIMKAARHSADLTRQLLAFARKQTISPKPLDINQTIGNMIKILKHLIGEDIDLAWMPGEAVRQVMMDPAQMDQILANLCVNARDAITDVGKITIETGNADFDGAYCADHLGFIPGEYAFFAVSDTGCGVEPGALDNIFDPFFTTKELGRGTGLGLATIYGIVKQNNGFINVYSEPGHGTIFKIYLPWNRSTENFLPAHASPLRAEQGDETILLVEDEPDLLKMTTMMLQDLGYDVVAAGTPGEAIELARSHPGDIHLILTDVVMPEMNGRNLANTIKTVRPNIKCLFMSGYTANVIAHRGVLEKHVNFIQKPFSKEQLGAKIREMMANMSLSK
ncbi:PAS domain S-box protein [Desulfobacter postgatei]